MVKNAKRIACLAAALLLLFTSAPGIRAEGRIVHGPQTPPDGKDYASWKGIAWTADTAFDIAVSWYLYSKKNAPLTDRQLEEMDYRLEPEMPLSRFEIVRVEAEPVGGEMKLRSGGYVDITVTAESTSDFCYSLDASARDPERPRERYYITNDAVSGIMFSGIHIFPFDMHTGISLLNYIRNEDAESISPNEATDTGFVESRVTWQNRNYRILAREDHRNLGYTNMTRKTEDGRLTVCILGSVTELVYTFRVPADYGGMALCIPKTVNEARPHRPAEDSSGDPRELYADILTGSDGQALDPDNYYFIRLADLVAHFHNRPRESN